MIPRRSVGGELTSSTGPVARNILNIAGTGIAFGLISVLAYCTWALINVALPEGNENALMFLLGILSGAILQVVSFFFGSSMVTKQQTDIIDKQAEAAAEIRHLANPNVVVDAASDVEVASGETIKVHGTD